MPKTVTVIIDGIALEVPVETAGFLKRLADASAAEKAEWLKRMQDALSKAPHL